MQREGCPGLGPVQAQSAAAGAEGRPGAAPGGAQEVGGGQRGAGEGLQGQGGDYVQASGIGNIISFNLILCNIRQTSLLVLHQWSYTYI